MHRESIVEFIHVVVFFHPQAIIFLAVLHFVIAIVLVKHDSHDRKFKVVVIHVQGHAIHDFVLQDTFPFDPPFVRVITPVISGGYVLGGGAICMELLTKQVTFV